MLAFTPSLALPLRPAVLPRASRSAARLWRASRPSPAPRAMCAPPTDESVMQTVERKLAAALAPSALSVTPAYGDPNGSHVSIYVVSDAFDGLGAVKRHRLVYKAIWDELQGPIHAVDKITAKTPAEV